MKSKTCTKCKRIKPVDKFPFNKFNKPKSWCKDCQREYCREYSRKKNNSEPARIERAERRRQQHKDGFKECGACEEIKPINEFSISGKYINSWCKECHRKSATDRYWEQDKAKRQTDSDYKRRQNENAKRYRESEKGKKTLRDWRKAHKNSQQEKKQQQARDAVRNEIRRNRMSPASEKKCHHCNKQAQEYHHYNGYEKKYRLDVIPLCKECHEYIHHYA